jgi:hypothetical protein
MILDSIVSFFSQKEEPFLYIFIKDIIRGLAVSVTAIAFYWKYSQAKKKESTERLLSLFNSFYLNDKFDELRIWLDDEGNYKKYIEAPITEYLRDPDAGLKEDHNKQLCKLDTVLKYLEFILYLEKNGNLKEKDREAIFGYWFRLLAKPHRNRLRVYITQCRFDKVDEFLTKNFP